MPRATITSKGQVTIPKEVREHLHVDTGDKVDFVVQGDGTVLVRPLLPVTRLKGLLYRPGQRAATIEEMNDAIAESAVDRYLRATRRRK